MQAELLLISRDAKAIERYLPKLERCADFIETRRDPKNNLFLAGPAGNLLAPNYAGWKKPDGTYGKAYLAGLSVTYIAALDRVIELEKLAGNPDRVELYAKRRDLARKGLPLLTTDEGYLVKYIDPDGTKHGVYGAAKHGYFAASPNHDAVCFGVVDDGQAAKIYAKIASIPGLRPNDFIIANCPGLDDMYASPDSWLWMFGTWVNGGHWSTCEGRMMMAYSRLGKFEDARSSMKQLMTFARRFRMDNPLVDFGAKVYQPNQPINLCYDSFGPPAGLLRGLFEYNYAAKGLTLVPHIPPGITRLEQRFGVRFGAKRLFLATAGTGPITSVTVNGKAWTAFDGESVSLPFDQTPRRAAISIAMGNAKPMPFAPPPVSAKLAPPSDIVPEIASSVITPNRLPLRIGADSGGGSRFVGDIGRAMVFSRALSDREVAALASGRSAKPIDDAELVGDWMFDTKRAGEFVGAPGGALVAKPVGKVEVVGDPAGKALRLSGAGFVAVADDPRLDFAKACTMVAWIKPGTLPGGGARIIDKTTVGASDGFLLDTHPGNSLRAICRSGMLSHDAKLTPGRWVHVAATIADNGGMTLFVDGKAVAQQPKPPAPKWSDLPGKVRKMHRFHERLAAAGLGDSYEAAHARLVVEYLAATNERTSLLKAGKLKPLAEPSASAADRSYLETTAKLCDGLEKVIDGYKTSNAPRKKSIHRIWAEL